MQEKQLKAIPFWVLTILKLPIFWFVFQGILLDLFLIKDSSITLQKSLAANLYMVMIWVFYIYCSLRWPIKWKKTHLWYATLFVLLECVDMYLAFYLWDIGIACLGAIQA